MLKIPSNVLQFAQDKIDVYTAFNDYVNHYRAINEDKKVDFDKSVTFEEKSEKMNEALRKEIARVAGVADMGTFTAEVWASNPNMKWATFAVIGAMIDMVLPQSIIDSIGMYAEVIVGGYGDSFAFDVKPNDLFIVTKAGRGKRQSEVHKQFDGQITVQTVEHDITVGVSLYRVLAGKENLAEFAMKAVKSIETQMSIDAYTSFSTVMGNLVASATLGTVLRYTGYSQDKLVKLAQTVTAYNQGQKAVIVGTQLALSKILPTDGNYRYTLDSEYVKLGYIKNFAGFDVMVLPQVASLTVLFDTILDDDKIYIVSPAGGKMVKLCIEGSMMTNTNDAQSNANLTSQTVMKKMWGTAVATNNIYGCIEL